MFLSWLFWGSLSAGCGHEKHDEREWTKEELAELEAKWGFDVSSSCGLGKTRQNTDS